jgi:hypothetical protein
MKLGLDKLDKSRNYDYYNLTKLPMNGTFRKITLNFTAEGFLLANDSGNVIEVSFDGTNTHFELLVGEVLTRDNWGLNEIWLKAPTGTNYRLSIW